MGDPSNHLQHQPSGDGNGLPSAAAHAPALVAAVGAVAAVLVLALVPRFEGLRYVGYRDIAGVVTACAGHTRTAVLGRRYTPQQCADFLVSDLVAHAKDLRCITTPLLPHQTAALLSFAFSVGPGGKGVKDGLCTLKSGQQTTLVRLANAGDMAGACAQISQWTGVRGRNCAAQGSGCAGIVHRRAAERAMCEGRYLGADLPAASGVAPGAVPGAESGAAP